MNSVLIAGAGIIGLATALELATRGVEVTILERGVPMQEASWAAAGMLAVNDPENPPLLTPLSQLSLSLYPDFLSRIEQLSGRIIPLRTNHTFQICAPEHTPAGVTRLSPAEAATRVAGIASQISGDLLWLDESSLDPRDLCQALPIAVEAAGVCIVRGCSLHSVRYDHGQVVAHTSGSTYYADAMVIACGAWSGSVKGASQLPLPAFPKKGQMIAVRLPAESATQLDVVIRSPEIYLVPRGHSLKSDQASRIVVGATVEDAGFDRSIRPEATEWLLAKAAALWPPIRKGRIEDVWTGLRPATPDGLPVIGPSGLGVFYATGHYRNGILLAPATGRIVAASLLGQQPPINPAPFSPARFDQTLQTSSSQQPVAEPDSVLL